MSNEERLKKAVLILAETIDYFRDHWKNNNVGQPCPSPYPNRGELIGECERALDKVYEILGTDKLNGYIDFDLDGGNE